MKRLAALVLGALAGLAALRLVRRGRDDASPDQLDADQQAGAGGETVADQAAELRRKLDQARQRDEAPESDETIGEARLDDDADDVEATAPSGGKDVEELSARRGKVHDRARDAAKAMRSNGDPGAA